MAKRPQRMVSGQVGKTEVALGGGRWPWGHCFQVPQPRPIWTQPGPGWGVKSRPSSCESSEEGKDSPPYALP